MKIWHDMKNLWQKAVISQPRWDGNRVLFAIETEGKRIRCAISRSALQELSGHQHLATSDLLRRFADSRERVEEIAARIFHITPEWVSGPVSIWADDIDHPPPALPCHYSARTKISLYSRVPISALQPGRPEVEAVAIA